MSISTIVLMLIATSASLVRMLSTLSKLLSIEILKLLRNAKQLSQSEMAAALEVSLSAYQKYEREKSTVMPSLDVLMRIADYHHVSVDYLLGRSDEINPYDLIPIPDADKAIMEQFAHLDDTTREIIINAMCKMVDAYRQSGDIEKVERIERTVGDLLDEMERERQAQEKDGA